MKKNNKATVKCEHNQNKTQATNKVIKSIEK